MALTPAAPNPTVAFAKGLMHFGEEVLIDPFTELFDWISAVASVDELDWRYASLVFARATPAGTTEDTAQIGFNITNITGGGLDSSWTTTDFTDCEAAIDEWWTAMQTYIQNTHTLREVRWYHRKFNPDLPLGSPTTVTDPATGKPYNRFADSGPPVRIHPVGTTGGNASLALPYQVAMSVTLRTAVPKHWGRVYLPGMGGSVMTVTGDHISRFTSAATVAIANQMAELIDDLNTKHFQLVVPTTQISGKFAAAIQTVSVVQVDDIPDVIRRRRPKAPTIRTIGAPLP